MAPHEFDAAVRTDQVARADPVVQPGLHVDAIVGASREIQPTVNLSADEGREFNAPLGSRRRYCHNGPSNCYQ